MGILHRMFTLGPLTLLRMYRLKPALIVLTGALFLILFALYDGYPIVTNDTGTYLTSGFTLQPPDDRPLFYGVFVRLTSLGMSGWMPPLMQCVTLSYLLVRFIRRGVPQIPANHIAGLILLTSLGTLAGWYVGQLTPDIFVSIFILASVILFLENGPVKNKVILWLVMFLSALMHSSIFLMAALFCIGFFVVSLFFKPMRRYRNRLIPIGAVAFLAWLAISSSLYFTGKGFTSSRATHVFLVAKLAENGVLKTYLDVACNKKNYRICAYKEKLPPAAWEFHWNTDSPVHLTGGWESNRAEYNEILKDIYTTPRYYKAIMFKAVESTFRQLVLLNIDGWYGLPWTVMDEGTAPYNAIRKYFPHELNEFRYSRQNTKTFNIALLNNSYHFLFIVSSLLVLFFLNQSIRKEAIIIYLIIFSFLFLNAFVTANLSSVNERLNSRAAWLVSFVNIYFVYKMIILRWGSQKRSSYVGETTL